jgi:hypothetical protein
VGALTKGNSPSVLFHPALLTLSQVYGTSTNTSGIYGTVAAIFLFQGAYSVGWTPLLYLYPPEVLNYPIRANGMGVFTFFLNGVALLCVFSFPFALEAMGWKTYMMNGSWDVLEVGFIWWYWVETKGKSLEEIDEVLEGKKHSDVPDLENIRTGKEDLGDMLAEFDGVGRIRTGENVYAVEVSPAKASGAD